GAALAAEGPAPVEIPQASPAEPVIAFGVRRDDPTLALVVAGLENSVSREPLALLAEIASAVLDRMSAEHALIQHAEHVRALGEKLLTLGTSSLEHTCPADATTVGSPPDTEALTAREREILEIVASGASNAEIADQLTLSIETVKTHVKRILRKMNAANRSELIAAFSPRGAEVK
ncbi:MAG: helix-turn-helix transcriptional regulator, partial [Gordonia polyisoprenivorans]|nr:helix-turn-helix transcriptional regulator [Gordonia polyisoprenivorans]